MLAAMFRSWPNLPLLVLEYLDTLVCLYNQCPNTGSSTSTEALGLFLHVFLQVIAELTAQAPDWRYLRPIRLRFTSR